MSLQLSTQTNAQKKKIYERLKIRQASTFTFQIDKAATIGNFSNPVSSGIFQGDYATPFIWTPPTTLLITGFEWETTFLTASQSNIQTFCQVNVENTFFIAPIATSTQTGSSLFQASHWNFPTLLGNFIDDNNYTESVEMFPFGFYNPANKPLYIFFGTSLSGDGITQQSLTIRAIVTGAQI